MFLPRLLAPCKEEAHRSGFSPANLGHIRPSLPSASDGSLGDRKGSSFSIRGISENSHPERVSVYVTQHCQSLKLTGGKENYSEIFFFFN